MRTVVNFLFIHGNYPAQFRHLIASLGTQPEHRVVFLTARDDADTEPIAGVEIKTYALHRPASESTHHYLIDTEVAVLHGQAVLRAIDTISDFRPDVVVTHAGMGMGLFIKEFMPDCLHVGYFEWYFQSKTAKYLSADNSLDFFLRIGMRNLPILLELEKCDVAIVPTEWQKSQFPSCYASKINVVFDGIDSRFFYPNSANLRQENMLIHNRDTHEPFLISKDNIVISYATRGMEPLRGFPEFLLSLPRLLSDDSSLIAIIAGADRRAYSFDAPSHEGSWKNHLLSSLGNFKGRDRVYFTGLLDYSDYRSLLWRTDLHCYFTRPYVTSWSFFEACMSGAYLASNKNGATDGIGVDETIAWVDLDNQDILAEQLSKALYSSEKKRSVIRDGFTLDQGLQRWGQILNQSLSKRSL